MPKGLTCREQVALALQQQHPWALFMENGDAQVETVVVWESARLPQDIDEFRKELMDSWASRAVDLNEQQMEWARRAHGSIRNLVMKLHGPLFDALAEAMGYEDLLLSMHLLHGFSLV